MSDAVIDLERSIVKKTKQAPDLWKEIGETVVQNTRVTQAQGRGSPDNKSGYKPFENLAESTLRQKKYKTLSSLSKSIKSKKSNLIESGKMHEDLTSIPDASSVEITHATDRSKEIASYHESGTANMPARKFMNLGKVNTKTVKNIILKYLDKILKGDR
jgi:phage gpG-like protein